MRIVRRAIDRKNGGGTVRVIIEDPEDIWHMFNMIQVGDIVKTSTVRKIKMESKSGSVSTSRKRITLALQVEAVEADPQASSLRVSGRVCEENQNVKMGAYHTFDIEIQTDFSLTKDVWDTFDLQRLEESADAANRSELAVVVMQEGLANVCLVTQSLTVVKSKIEATIPKKRRKNHISSHKYDSSLQRFFQAIYNALSVHIDWEKIKVLILASPSNLKEQCLDYMVQYEQELVNNSSGESGRFNLAGHRDAIVLASASSGFKRAVEEILTNPEMQTVIADVGVQHDMVLINEIFERLGRNQDTITYGLDEVQKAAEFGAIETLLICDSLLRTQDFSMRRRFAEMSDRVTEARGEVKVISSSHEAGQQLLQLGGIACFLRFPMPEEDLSDDEEDEDDDEESKN